MRLGWDHDQLNAPELGRQAQASGIVMLTVHGRTRCQFYKGVADWERIADTVDAVDMPVIANGDICDTPTAQQALRDSGAYGVMVGRSAMGQPWLPGQIAAELEGRPYAVPDTATRLDSLLAQIEDSQTLYGSKLGLRIVRKHISAAIDQLEHDLSDQTRRAIRAEACQIEHGPALISYLKDVFLEHRGVAA